MTLDTQLLTMVSMILGGIYLGFATETYRRIAISWQNKPVLTYFLEITYWILQTCVLFFVLYQVNNGELRIYIFIACLLGFSIYKVLFQKIYQRVLEWIIKIVVTIVTGLIKLIHTLIVHPVLWLGHLVIRIISSIIQFSYRFLLMLMKILFYPFKPLFHFSQKVIPKKIQKKVTTTLSFCSTIITKLGKWLKEVIGKRR